MILNPNLILSIILTSVFIFLSFIFFQSGYNKLKNSNINYVDKVIIKNKKHLKFEKNLLNNNLTVLQPEDYIILKNIEKEIVITVKKNDTFNKLINPYVKNNKIKQEIINSINKVFDLRKLTIEQKIYFYIIQENEIIEINKIVIPLNFNTDLVTTRNKNSSKYFTDKISLSINKNLVSQKFIISKSIFEDGRLNDVPLNILIELIRLYSFDIDFQRDIKKNNKIELMYEIFYNEQRGTLSYGKIVYVNLTFKNNNLEYFLYKDSDGYLDYYNSVGKNVKKSLMKTPLDGAKVSSNFGMRKHPILGYNKLHLGVDFAAPTGTPVYAAGNGIIEYAGRNGGYGNYIRIRHNNSYKTAYAHLKGFRKGISKGVRVNQGETIGYIGSSGRSTGPHLHYEVIYQNKKINPMKLKLPSGKTLKGKDLEKFKKLSKLIYSDFLFNLYE